MALLYPTLRPRLKRRLAVVMLVLAATVLSVAVAGQEEFAIYLSAVDARGTPILELQPSDLTIRESVGPARIVSVSRFGWPLKVTVLLDNGPRTADALVHYRAGLTKFFEGLPPGIPVSLITTAPNPRWLFRETTDRVQIANGIGRVTPDEGFGRFSDALIEYARRLDEEFRSVSAERMQPYLPVLVSLATTHQDGSDVRRDDNVKMITSLVKHRVWTTMIMMAPSRTATEPGGLPSIDVDQGQNAEIAKAVQEVTRGRYVPVTGSGTSALSTTILPEVAQAIARRYIRQMTQHRIVLERPAGAAGPMRDFSLSLLDHSGATIVVSTDGSYP